MFPSLVKEKHHLLKQRFPFGKCNNHLDHRIPNTGDFDENPSIERNKEPQKALLSTPRLI